MNRRELLRGVGAASLMPAALAVPAVALASPAFQAALRLGPVQDGPGNNRWAEVVAGKVSGSQLAGRVQSGRMDWVIDPCSGAVEVALACSILRSDGTLIQLRDQTAPADGVALAGHPTAPVMSAADGAGPRRFAGRLDTTAFWRGYVSLRAFENLPSRIV